MSGPTLSPQTAGADLTPEQIGIGMRISIHPHADDFERIILDAIKHTNEVLTPQGLTEGLDIQTGEISTYVGVKTGDAAQILATYAATLIHSASRASQRRHLTSHILLSRGCPGGATCELIPGEIPAEKRVFLEKSGIPAAASWSLYPLTDGNLPHLEPINQAIQEVKDSGLDVSEEHLPPRCAETSPAYSPSSSMLGHKLANTSHTWCPMCRCPWIPQAHSGPVMQHDRHRTTTLQLPQPV